MKGRRQVAKTLPEEPTFEEALAQLDGVVRDLEDGQIGLEESLTRYELGVNLIKRCQVQLRQAEQRIQLLTGVDEDGQPTLQAFQPLPGQTGSGEIKSPRKKASNSDDPT
jgi:exodeoxyribonuclease VII small subunit